MIQQPTKAKMPKRPKAVLLLSGGLDSTLAGKLLLEMNVDVEAINFVSIFCQCTPKSASCPAARAAAQQLGIPVHVFVCGEDYLEVVKHPRFGRGSGVNPCIDCRIHMFRRARTYMEETGADFVATGEVLDERPMSQRRKTMEIIERESGLAGRIVRPLCARLLAPSIPEQEGLIDRSGLKAIRGRRRRPQIDLAEQYGLDYLCPAGGCLLTDKEFAARFSDLLEHSPNFDLHDARLLRIGRHFRLPDGNKVIVGRNENENERLKNSLRDGDVLVMTADVAGPSALCSGADMANGIEIAARLVATYTKGGCPLRVKVQRNHGQEETLNGLYAPFDRQLAEQWRVGVRRNGTSGDACQLG